MRLTVRSIALAAIAGLCASSAQAGGILTFDGQMHGDVYSTMASDAPASHFTLPTGLSYIQVINRGGGPDIGVVYDSEGTRPQDPDLERRGGWSGGNLAPNTNLGMLAVIQENRHGCGDGRCNYPDDEGTRPQAGSIIFQFDHGITSIGADLIDVEGPVEWGSDAGYIATFHLNNQQVAQIGFEEFVTNSANNPFYDASIEFGNNTANRIAPITADQLGVSAFDRVEFNFGGSAAIDNIVWTDPTPPNNVSEPGSLLLMGLAIAGLGARRRRG